MAVHAPPSPSPTSSHERGRRSRLLLAAIAIPAALLALVLGLVLLLAGIVDQQRRCAPAGLPGAFDGPGTLGGIAGTGLTPAQIRTVRTGSPYRGSRITPGRYLSTAYGPPWGGIQGAGAFTSGGIALAGGAPRLYMIAVDPLLISHGTLVYAWPNPFHWPGPFLAADTGTAIKGRHIDFYDWRGRRTQLRWHQPNTTISGQPIKPGGPDIASVTAPGPCPAAAVSGPLGRRIATIARGYVGRGPRIPGFHPPSTTAAWCEWFASNVYRQARVPGWPGTDLYSGTPYTWANARGQLFKAAGQPPKGHTPPLGAAVMYGPGPQASEHVNLVTRIYPDGSFELTGGNQSCPTGGANCVSRRGPCRLTPTAHAHLTGPACGDGREVYGIAAPARGPA
jgi:3D (Asp-Asp-Asp) domain-containing protein